jgi:hypothetical protein
VVLFDSYEGMRTEEEAFGMYMVRKRFCGVHTAFAEAV